MVLASSRPEIAFRPVHGGQVAAYDTQRYPFAREVVRLLDAKDLSRLHEDCSYARLKVGTDQQTVWHRRFYAGYEALQPLFRRFVREQLRPLFGEALVYQRVPTLRVHLPGNVGVGEFHEDGKYNHPDGEQNFLLPLTRAVETSTVWIESAVGRRDYRPVNLEYGELFAFDGRNFRHGNLPNETGSTRVSFDFRIVPYSRYQPAEETTINSGLRFALGGYYELCE